MVLSNKGFGRFVITVFNYIWKHTCQNLVMGFINFSLKVQHRGKEYCDDYFVRLGSQKIWHVKLLNKVANVLAI